MLTARWAGLVLAVFALASCARSPRTGPGRADPFPLVPGARWRYEGHAGGERFELEVVARGFETLVEPSSGRKLRIFVMDETLRPAGREPSTSPAGYLHEGGYLSRLIALAYDDQHELRSLGQDEPTRMLPLDAKPGDHWTQRHRLFTTLAGGKPVQWEGEVEERSAVAVPAGTFADAIQVRLRYSDASLGGVGPLLVYLDTYAPGVGLVRSLALDPAGDQRKTVELSLVDYRIPGAPGGTPTPRLPGRGATR